MPDPLVVAYVFDDAFERNDGVQQYIKTLGRWMHAQDVAVHYFVGESNLREQPSYGTVHSLSKNVRVKANQNRLSIPLPTKNNVLKNVLEAVRPNVLHVQTPYSPMMSGRLIKVAQKQPTPPALVGTFHIVGETNFERHGSKVLSTLQRKQLASFDKMTYVSTAARQFAQSYFQLGAGEIIPNAIDPQVFKQARSQLSKSSKKTHVAYLNRLVERKGCDLFLAAVNHLRHGRKRDDFHFDIGGDGPMRPKLEQYVRDNDLKDVVTFHGFIDESNKASFLATANLACFPSTGGESFGIVLLEAMASGTAILAGDNVGYRSTVGELGEAQLVQPRDVKAFVDKILELTDQDPQQIIEGQDKLMQRFDVTEVGGAWLKIYRELAGSKP